MSEEIAVMRPATVRDLKHFYDFANEAGPGITSLPREKSYLENQLTQSERAFAGKLGPDEKEIYLFCLEIDGNVIGTAGIVSHVGVNEPFFAYHRRLERASSSFLGIEREVAVLHFIEARKKPTEIGTLYIKKEYRGKGFGPLLSYSRLLFLAAFRNNFSDHVIAEMRGFNENGISPFWECVGRPFFGIEFSQADHLRITNPEVIHELFPRYPLYSILLPKQAQEVIGIPHHNTIPAVKMLQKQGFKFSEYLDILDAGPHLYAITDQIHAVKESKKIIVRELRSELKSERAALVANTKRKGFRMCLSPIAEENGRLVLPLGIGKALDIDIGEEILYYEKI